MAIINNKAIICLLFAFALVSMMSTTESKRNSFFTPAVLVCNSVIGVKSGDTCFDIANNFNLSSKAFESINPNLNCDEMFVGEWICVKGQ
ncbi:lysM domain-containing protein [Artemisia annua]|uniref:LysM domain-containing protein n=1 Tax=Artemisia annua TaxID=35608 RepID=A0A2U1LU81_ARTAN|nr:lysM domain-containing protein [Artemisia annua]